MKNARKDNAKYYRMAAQFVMLSLILFYTRNIWCHDKIIIFSDIDFGLNDSTYISRMLGVFNQYFSSMNFFNMSRLFLMYPLYLFVLLTGKVTSGYLLKGLLLVIFITSAFGMYKLCERLLKRHFTLDDSIFSYMGLVIPSLYYTINPWVFMRIQHVFLLAGYACFPWVLYYFFEIFDITEESWRTDIKEVTVFNKTFRLNQTFLRDLKNSIWIAFFVAIGSAAIHYFFFIVLTMVFFSLAICIKVMSGSENKAKIALMFIKKNMILYASIFLLCAYWIIPYFIALLSANIEPNNVNVVDTLGMFSRNSSLVNIVYLISYWWPMFNKEVFLDLGFYVGGGAFLVLVAMIVFYRFKWSYYIRVFSICALVLLLFSTGLNVQFIDEMYITIVTKVPVIGHVFRDPNKIVGLMIAFVSILISFSIDRYFFKIRKEGFGVGISIGFLIVMFGLHYMYIRPLDLVFSEYFYSGSAVPDAYKQINSHLDVDNGKILWTPTMDNMVLSNGTANYKWNIPEEEHIQRLNLQRLAGDFHFYSSLKPSIFQHENNDGMVSYMYTFMQYMLDCTGAQHYGILAGWLGFNEMGFHNDVYKQEQRQKFNLDVIQEQKDLELKYSNDIFRIYNTPTNFDKAHGTTNSVLHTKGLFPFVYMLDFLSDLKISPENTAALWSQAKKSDYALDENDLVIGNNVLDIYLPFVNENYFVYPFDKINTGNPYIGWAKTMTKEGEWLWLMKTNNIKSFDFEQDYSHGVAYTYVAHKLDMPYYKLKQQDKTIILGINDILDDFFTPDNDDIFKMTIFPEVETGKEVLQGTIKKGLPGTNSWQVAKSKTMEIDSLQGEYLNISALVSGVNAGTVNFKIRLMDKNNKELGVSYLSNPNNSAEYVKTEMDALVYIPSDAKYMRIDILSTQDVNRSTYFWIHDFQISDITSTVTDNALEVNLPQGSPSNQYRLFMRSFNAYTSSNIQLVTDSGSKTVSCKSEKNKFEWTEVGTVKSIDGKLKILPSEGFNAINAFVAIPVEVYDKEMARAKGFLKGQQADLSLIPSEWDVETELEIKNIKDAFIFANTINGTMTLINGGTVSKAIDIIHADDYRLNLTGNLKSSEVAQLEIYQNDQRVHTSGFVLSDQQPKRNFENEYFALQDIKDQYFLKRMTNVNDNWRIQRYTSNALHLEPGRYTFKVKLKQASPNALKLDSLHFIEPEEVVVPAELIDKDAALQSMLIPDIETSRNVTPNGVVLNNRKSDSKLWIIGGLNKTYVKRGQRIVFSGKIDAKGVREVHGKLLWVDQNNKLLSTDYVPYDVDKNELYLMTEAKTDGYVLPCIFYQSVSKQDGALRIKQGSLMTLDEFSKLEGAALLPDNRVLGTEQPKFSEEKNGVSGEGIKYLVQNEAYNVYWKYIGKERKRPELVNFIHNGYDMEKEAFNGSFAIEPKLILSFKISLILSMLIGLVMGAILIILRKI